MRNLMVGEDLIPHKVGGLFPQSNGSGDGLVYDSSNESQAAYKSADYTDPRWIAKTAVTIGVKLKLFSHASSGTGGIGRAATNDVLNTYYSFKVYSGDTQFVIQTANLKVTSSGTGVPINTWLTLFGTYAAKSGVSCLYRDGIEISTASHTTQNLNTGTSLEAPFKLGPGTLDDATRAFDGQIAWAAMWKNRALSPVEVASMTSDPYQFLIPA